MATPTRRLSAGFPRAAIRAARSGAELLRLSTRTGEMMLAAGQTIGHRTRMLHEAAGDAAAMADPEFSLMGWEKIEAAWRSQDAMRGKAPPVLRAWGTWLSIQARLNATAMTRLARCRSAGEVAAVQRRYLQGSATNAAAAAGRLAQLGIATAAVGLTPVHKAATANARRLGRRGA